MGSPSHPSAGQQAGESRRTVSAGGQPAPSRPPPSPPGLRPRLPRRPEGKRALRRALASMGFPSWEMPPPGGPAPGGPGASPQRPAAGGEDAQAAGGIQTPNRHGDPRTPAARPPASRRRGAGTRPRGAWPARGRGRVLARLGEVSGVVTETRQYGGDRPRPLAEEPPNTR